VRWRRSSVRRGLLSVNDAAEDEGTHFDVSLISRVGWSSHRDHYQNPFESIVSLLEVVSSSW
jgi:hypothetical protein